MFIGEKVKYFPDDDGLIVFNVSTGMILKLRGGLGNVVQMMLPECYSQEQLERFEKKVNDVKNDDARDYLLKIIQTSNYEQITDQQQNITISFAPVHKCNLRCKYCYADGGRNFSGQEREISVELLKQIFSFVLTEYNPNIKDVVVNLVSGGEPFLGLDLCTHINEIIDDINPELRRKIFIGTNLTMLDESVLEKLKKINPQLGVSIDGDEEVHNCNRIYENGAGSYDIVRKNLIKLKNTKGLSAKTRDCLFMTVVNEDNLELVKILKHHKELGASSVQMKVARKTDYSDKGISENNIERFEQAYEKLSVFLLEEFKKGNIEWLKMILNTTDYFGKFVLALMLGEHNIYRCGAGRDKLSFNADGDIYPCDNFMNYEEYKLGNIFDGQPVNRKFLQYSVDNMEDCRKCWARYICSGECHFNSFIHTGNVEKPSKIMCRFFQNNITLAIKLIIHMQEADMQLYKRLLRTLQVKDRNNVIK